MNSTGSYGFNFSLVKKGSAESYPLFIHYDGPSLAARANGGKSDFINCYVLLVDDWLPIQKKDGSFGDNSYMCCYHQNFNIYTDQNPIPTTGTVKTYLQKRYIESVHYAERHLPIDASRIYTTGTSHTGYGALLTAAIYPEEISAVYDIVEPISIGSNGVSVYEEEWGTSAVKLNTDVLIPGTSDPLLFTKLSDMRRMTYYNRELDVPLIFDVHGKNDDKVGWTDGKIEWFDSLQSNHYGGVWYWDQREHGGGGKNFSNDETTPDIYRYQNNKSYPAFSNCSINQDPGNGSKNDGDPYGAINGYLDWDDSIIDNSCNYSVNIFIKDFYVGGVLDQDQYKTCTTDLTFRRLQDFKPSSGTTITWKNLDNSNNKIQSGSFTYKGGLMTLKGMIVNKSGNIIFTENLPLPEHTR
ncbi:MAG: hypothetical protein H0W62_00645 [Chitinophagales bacterium]|nr:hypothetical protein [Chitinophagales bacterium]